MFRAWISRDRKHPNYKTSCILHFSLNLNHNSNPNTNPNHIPNPNTNHYSNHNHSPNFNRNPKPNPNPNPVYEATLTTKKTFNYIKAFESSFKTQFNNHKMTFSYKKYKQKACLLLSSVLLLYLIMCNFSVRHKTQTSYFLYGFLAFGIFRIG